MTTILPAKLWDEPDLRRALAAREMPPVYRSLRERGLTIHQIAEMTSQSRSEVSEILQGRQVIAMDVITRIGDGLGVPRSYLGLAYDTPREPVTEEERRRFLAHAAEVTMGSDVVDRPDSAVRRRISAGLAYVIEDVDRVLRGRSRASRRAVSPVPRRAIGWAMRTLPSTERQRYLDEFLSELDELAQSTRPLRAQLRYTIRLLWRVPVLRFALREPDSRAKRIRR